ncbi:MAG: glycosyltransferase family 4 protein, partial [Cyclobacteriaceae bacterium]|nr:glycosyltransferase family 4 protein [Cyclobacteriaceae bacterium]
MNILIITYQGNIAGSTNSISYLATGLARRGHTVVVGLRKASLLYKMLEDTPVIREPMVFRSRFDLKNMRHIREVVTKYNITIINAQSSIDRYTSIFSKWLYSLPVKIIHTRRQPPKSIGGLQNLFYKAGTDAIVVISDTLKDIFISHGIPENHLKVIYNGIPASRYQEWSEATVQALREKYQIQEGDTVIGCVSRLKRQKQIVEAIKLLNRPAVKLFFAGIEKIDLQQTGILEGLQNEVIFTGTVPSEEVLNVYKLFSVNILASVTDGFGLVLLESMAMGCPVIATDFGGIRDVVQHEKNGLLFKDNDIQALASNIEKILDHPEE